jgi:hypothetical protein
MHSLEQDWYAVRVSVGDLQNEYMGCKKHTPCKHNPCLVLHSPCPTVPDVCDPGGGSPGSWACSTPGVPQGMYGGGLQGVHEQISSRSRYVGMNG